MKGYVTQTFAIRRSSDALAVSGNGPVSRTPPFLSGPARSHALLHSRIPATSIAGTYFAEINERVWVETSARHVEPDMTVIHAGIEDSRNDTGGVALATRTQPLVFEVTDDEQTENGGRDSHAPGGRRREARDGDRGPQPGQQNARRKGPGTVSGKQREVLGSPVHLVEIDLLRGGEHTTPMSLERLRRKAGPFDYHVSVHRFEQPGRFFVYAWKLEDPLPEIAVPLLPGDGEMPLDLAAVFTPCLRHGTLSAPRAVRSNALRPAACCRARDVGEANR